MCISGHKIVFTIIIIIIIIIIIVIYIRNASCMFSWLTV
jgi:hypothetical protein